MYLDEALHEGYAVQLACPHIVVLDEVAGQVELLRPELCQYISLRGQALVMPPGNASHNHLDFKVIFGPVCTRDDMRMK